jgi:hypothetical protein
MVTCVPHVTGRQKYPEIGTQLTGLDGKLRAVHPPRHYDIGKHDVDPAVTAQMCQSFLCVARHDDIVMEFLEALDSHIFESVCRE